MLKRIGAEESGEFKAIASGTLPSGRPVVVNADGTVSVPTSTSSSVGSTVNFESAQVEIQGSAYDSNSNRVVFAYKDSGNSNYATAVVGTVSGTSISFGTPVVFDSASMGDGDACFDSTNNKIVISWKDGGNSDRGTAIVGTVSGTSISFGTKNQYDTNTCNENKIAFDSNSGKVAIVYRDGGSSYRGACVIGTVSGTDISFGSQTLITSGTDQAAGINCAFDSAGKLAVAYRNSGDADGDCVIGTISGTSISFGSIVNFANADDVDSITYDSTNDKIFITFRDTDNSSYLTGIVGTISGTSISFGTKQVIDNASSFVYPNGAGFDAASGNIVVSYRSQASGNPGKLNDITISGTSFTVGTQFEFESGDARDMQVVYDSTAEKTVIGFRDTGDSSHGKALVYTSSSQNLTSENYIGMSRGVAVQTGSASTTSSEITFESATTSEIFSAYDTNSDRVVITYRDHGNSDYGTAVVGNVSGSSITFGTPVVYYSNLSQENSVVFDSSNNKIVISWIAWDVSNNRNGTSIVGTVSGTSISFGSATQFNTTETTSIASVFDSSNNKVVVAYRDLSNSNVGTARVGTVSGTSISFGSEVVFENAGTAHIAQPVFDSSNNKVVLAYRDDGNSNYGTAIVGTVSGTSISFGSPVLFAGNTACTHMEMAFDTSANKVVLYYVDDSDNTIGKAVVGTVSGTSISFGSPVNINGSSAADKGVVIYDSNANRHVIFFRDEGDSNKGKVVSGLVSGTSISFTDAETISDGNTGIGLGQTFDPDQNKVILTFDAVSNAYGTAVLHTPSTIATTRGQVTNGQAASVDVIGSVSTNQIGLTAGQQYFVQTDGTISTTAGSPSVLAGTAISATELVVKT
jgi:hypothetical protein